MRAAAGNAQRERGFTLIELLVAMVVLALLLGVASTSLSIARQTTVAATRALDTAADLATAQDFLYRQLSAAVQLPRNSRGGMPSMEGDHNSLSFVGALPEHLGAQLYRFTMMLETELPERPLMILAVPIDALTREPERFILLHEVRSLSIAYFGPVPDNGDPSSLAWQQRWVGRQDIPRLIRIEIVLEGRARMQLPALFVHPLVS